MEFPVGNLPKSMPMQVWRPPDAGIPPTAEQRAFLKKAAAEFVVEHQLTPPMPFDELREHAEDMLDTHKIETNFRDYVAVLLNNASWEDTLAGIPFERRLLLMPKCMRKEEVCSAPFDELGLLCKDCGQCSLPDFQEEAERMGYAVLIAEGSALVTAIIETGKIDAIVGVSCLSVLEKAFPFMEAAAIPGIAVPLLQGDCLDTNVDLDHVWDVIHLTSEDKTRRMNLDTLRSEVTSWFTTEALSEIMGPTNDPVEITAREWLGGEGKRWRPYLAACAWRALQDDLEAPFPDDFKKVAVAVECFHKASLIHDDIEDDDDLRYGEPTMHAVHGVDVALNAGDLLIGEGYRLIGEAADAGPTNIVSMLRIAAQGQRDLCLGQGTELNWARNPKALKPAQVVEIFARKTSPAFEVALRVGAAYAGADEATHKVLAEYSNAMGIAYQINDDLDDHSNTVDPNDIEALRPTLLLALAHQKATGDTKKYLGQLWQRQRPEGDLVATVNNLYEELEVLKRAENLLESYKERAVMSLKTLHNPNLKGLLRRVLGKIFTKVEIKEWCREYETRNAASREASTPIVV